MLALLARLLCLCTLLLGACQEPPPLRVAIVAPLTRFSSEFGTEGRNGALLAIEEINAQGGINGRLLEPEVHDVGGGADLNTAVLAQLLRSGTRYIVGPYTSNMAQSTMEAMHGANALLITPTMSSPLLEGKPDAILRIQTTNLSQIGETARHMKKRGVRRVAALFDASNREYTQTLVQGLFQALQDQPGLYWQEDSILPGQREPQDVAQALSGQKFDAIYIASTAQRSAIIAQILRRNGNQAALYGCSWNMTDELLTQGGSAVEGMVFAGPTPPAGVNPRGLAFEKRFIERFGKPPSFAGAESYEAIQALAYGLRRADPAHPLSVRDTLLRAPRLSGVYDDFTWDKNGDVRRPITLVEIHQGRFRLTGPR